MDPGAALDDDVLAFQMRAAMAIVAARNEEVDSDDPVAQARAMERWIKESTSG